MKNIYQFAAWIGSEIDGINDEKFMAAAWILYAWMRREVIDCIPLPEFPATVSGSTKKGRSVAVIYQPEEHFFTLRSSVFESGIRDTVEAEIKPYRHSLLLAVRETVFLREPGSKAKACAQVAGICAPADRRGWPEMMASGSRQSPSIFQRTKSVN